MDRRVNYSAVMAEIQALRRPSVSARIWAALRLKPWPADIDHQRAWEIHARSHPRESWKRCSPLERHRYLCQAARERVEARRAELDTSPLRGWGHW